jgi:ubiquinone/menaquinone biosynthesis C-methylase UbiE
MRYDETNMPAAYDAGRDYSPRTLAYWLDVISRSVSANAVQDILDLGCGTGRYSAALASHFDAQVVALDPSEKMLAEARRKVTVRVRYARACGESLPLRDASVDLVFISMVFHHFDDPGRAVRECRRVLRTGGSVCMRAGTTEQINTYPYVPFFEKSRGKVRDLLQPRSVIESVFRNAGFDTVRHELVRSEVAPSWAIYAEKIAHRADSILAQLSDDEFNEGLAALRKHAASAPQHEAVVELVDFFSFT